VRWCFARLLFSQNVLETLSSQSCKSVRAVSAPKAAGLRPGRGQELCSRVWIRPSIHAIDLCKYHFLPRKPQLERLALGWATSDVLPMEKARTAASIIARSSILADKVDIGALNDEITISAKCIKPNRPNLPNSPKNECISKF
jgi:hypothetical protein